MPSIDIGKITDLESRQVDEPQNLSQFQPDEEEKKEAIFEVEETETGDQNFAPEPAQ